MEKYQQGDVLLIKVTEKEFNEAKLRDKVSKHRTRAVLAEGEETGHYHAIYMDDLLEDAEVTLCKSHHYRRVNDGVIVKNKPVQLKHEEHNTITLPPGFYLQKIVREFDHISGRTRGVID
jgi:5-keto 4-deoxyuronate isomerase